MIQLDQNAGLPISQDAMQQYLLYSVHNNIYGFGDQKLQLQKEVEQKRQSLCKLFGFDRVIYNSGATQAIHDIFNRIQNIKSFGGQHPTVVRLESQIQRQDGVCLMCLVNSATSYIQLPTKEQTNMFQYIILDVSQAIGKGKFGSSNIGLPRQGEKNVHCMFFSNHKLGGPKGSGFIICSNEFYDRYMTTIDQIELKENDKKAIIQLHPDLQQKGSFDISGFMSSAYLLETIQLPSKKEMYNTFIQLTGILKQQKRIKNILPELKEINNINDYPNCFSSITFELEGLCPRSFQHVLENNGVQIGFETACQSGQTGILRMSWRQPIKSFSVIEKQFEQGIKYLEEKENDNQLHGGKKLQSSFLSFVNNNKFWLLHHFAPSHDLEPNIDQKYEIMFQPDLLKQFTTISLKIPPHHASHRTELDILKKKQSGEEFDAENDGIRIQKRRLSKYLWINNPDAEYELSLEDFEKEKLTIFLSDQVFRSVDDNLVLKKQLPTEFEKEVNKYEIEIKKYPETLLQEIIVKHPNPEQAPPKQTRRDKPRTNLDKSSLAKKTIIEKKINEKKINEKNKIETPEPSEVSESESLEESTDVELEGGRRDPDYIRPEIKFLITSYNLRLLTSLGGNNLSVSILTNLDKLYRRGEKPSRYSNPHQCIVQDLEYITYQNCLGTLLTSMRLMKEIDFNYPQFVQQTTSGISIISQRKEQQPKFNKPLSTFNSIYDLQFSTQDVEDKIIIQQIGNTDITQIKKLLESSKPSKIVIYLPNINTDEIEEDYGLYYYFKQNNFKYEIDFIQYYDVWTHQYKQDKQIVKFYK